MFHSSTRTRRVSRKARIIGGGIVSVALVGGLFGSVFGISPVLNASAAPKPGECINYGKTISDPNSPSGPKTQQVKHDCKVIKAGAFGYNDFKDGNVKVGRLEPGKAWFACQVEGRRATTGTSTNTWWAYTRLDTAYANNDKSGWGWVPVTRIVQGKDNEKVPGLRVCNEAPLPVNGVVGTPNTPQPVQPQPAVTNQD